MKVKTSELSGTALDWAVAKAEELTIDSLRGGAVWAWTKDALTGEDETIEIFRPSKDGAQGWPIIDREGILLRPIRKPAHSFDGLWLAKLDAGNTGQMVHWNEFQFGKTGARCYWKGPTSLIAAMRCYAASELGDEIDVPDDLLEPTP